MQCSKILDCLDKKINEHYKTWLSHARGLTRDRDASYELLHTVLDSVINSGKAREIACREDRSESIKYYVDRAIWLRFFTDKANKRRHVYLEEMLIERANTPTEYHIEGEHLDILLNWLTEYERELILTYTTKGFTYVMAAEVLGMDRTKLKRDIDKAIKQLRKYVEDSGVLTPD